MDEPEGFFAGIGPLIADADALVVNLETVLDDDPPDIFAGQKRYLGWDNPERTLATLRAVGVDAVTFANNHAMDFGAERAAQSVRLLAGAGIPSAGFGTTDQEARAPLRLSVGGVTVFIFPAFEFRQSYQQKYGFYAGPNEPGVLGFDEGKSLSQLIGPYRVAYPDSFIIFAPHWGGAQNYGWATEGMERLGTEALAAGADVVIGHGAHALQELDFRADGTIIFSLGNFVFNSPGRYTAAQGFPFSFVARLLLEPARAGVRLYPFFCDNKASGFLNRPVDAEEFERVLQTLEGRPIPRGPLRDMVTRGRDSRGYYLQPIRPLSPRFREI